MEGGVSRRRRLVQFLHHRNHRVEVFLRVGRDDQRVGGRLAGDADLAIEPSNVPVRLLLRVFVEEIIRALLRFLEEQLVENVFKVARADVFQGDDSWRQIVVLDRFIQFGDHVGDALHRGGRGLHQQGSAPAGGHDAHLLGVLLAAIAAEEKETIGRAILLVLAQILQLFGHVLRVGVF